MFYECTRLKFSTNIERLLDDKKALKKLILEPGMQKKTLRLLTLTLWIQFNVLSRINIFIDMVKMCRFPTNFEHLLD